MITVLHTGDWQVDKTEKSQNKLKDSLEQILDFCSKNYVDYLLNAGDIYETPLQFRGGSGVDLIIKYLDELSKLVGHIIIVKGNNEHDAPGSISMLHQFRPNIHAFEYPLVLAFIKDRERIHAVDLFREFALIDEIKSGHFAEPVILFNLMPYPTKSALVIDAGIELNNENFTKAFDGLMNGFSIINNKFDCPKVFGLHGNVQGGEYGHGQTPSVGKEIVISQQSLRATDCNYYGFGHIHAWQEIQHLQMYYAGAVSIQNWGEVENKYFNVVKFFNDDDENYEPDHANRLGTLDFLKFKMDVEKHYLPAAKKMVKIDCEYTDGELLINNQPIGELVKNDAEHRIRITVKETERDMLADKTEAIKAQFGADTKIEVNVIPVVRESRSERIMDLTTPEDEIIEYCNVTGEKGYLSEDGKLKTSIMKKVKKIQSNQEA